MRQYVNDIAGLRQLTAADLEPVLSLMEANHDFLAPTSPLPPGEPFDPGRTLTSLRNRISDSAAATALAMVIIDGEGTLVGTLNVNSIIRGAFQSASLGYWVAEARNGQGLASAAVELAKEVATGELSLHRLQAETLIDNRGSQRVLEKNGFVRYGIAPDYLRIAGRWQPHALYQVTFGPASGSVD